MFVSECLSVNRQGHLTIDGKDTLELAARYGTPLYVMSEAQICGACRRFSGAIEKHYNGNGMAIYAGKAFCCKGICRIIAEEGMGLDVASGGELYTALAAGFPPEKLFFHGNNKTPQELSDALQAGVGTIVVDNTGELEMLEQMAASANIRQHIFFRIKPGVDAHTHDWVRTGSIDSKFGFALETGEAFRAIKRATEKKHVLLTGLHCHIGSQIFDIEPFETAARVMLELIAKVRQELGYSIAQLNLGGGFGIRYFERQGASEIEEHIARVAKTVKSTCKRLDIPLPTVLIEPGRAIVGLSGITLYRVGGIKEIPGARTYLSVDGGMGDNPRYALYRAEHEMLIANRASEPKTMQVTVAGHCCENDLLAEHIYLQAAKAGDVLAVLATGAYNYSMASNYNRYPRPPVVMTCLDGETRLLVRRETYEDVIRLDV